MTHSAVPTHPSDPASPSVAEIDASFRLPALALILKSAFCLVLGTFLLLLASVKLHAPAMMAGKAWLSYGRLQPAGWSVLVYGALGQAGAILALWLLARAARQRLQAPVLVFAGAGFWSVGVLFGFLGILTGASTGREWLEMPAGALACVVVGAGLIGASGWMTFAARTQSDTYPSAWFVLLALLSFVWFGTVATMMLGGVEAPHGVVQVLVQRWYAGGVARLWLGGFVVAIVLHFLPEFAQRPLANRSLALLAFWCLTFFAPWAVTAHGDPFPRWLVSVGLAGQFLSVMGLLAIALNWWKTVEGATATLFASSAGRLIAGAAAAYVAAGLLGFLGAFQGFAAATRFTWLQAGTDWLLVGSLVLAISAAVPEVLARVTGERVAPGLIGAQGMLALAGVVLTAVPLVFAGWIQGARLGDGSTSFVDALAASMHLVRFSTLGLTALVLSQVLLLVGVVGVVQRLVRQFLAAALSWATSTTAAAAATKSGGKPAGVRS